MILLKGKMIRIRRGDAKRTNWENEMKILELSDIRERGKGKTYRLFEMGTRQLDVFCVHQENVTEL